MTKSRFQGCSSVQTGSEGGKSKAYCGKRKKTNRKTAQTKSEKREKMFRALRKAIQVELFQLFNWVKLKASRKTPLSV